MNFRRYNLITVFLNIMLILGDILIITVSLFLAYATKFDKILFLNTPISDEIIIFFIFALIIMLLANVAFGCYPNHLNLVGIIEGTKLVLTNILSFGLLYIIIHSSVLFGIPIKFSLTTSFLAIFTVSNFILMFLIRFIYRIYKNSRYLLEELLNGKDKKRIILIGSPTKCKKIIEIIQNDLSMNKLVTACIVTDKNFSACIIDGVPLFYGDIKKIESYIEKYSAEEIIICSDGLSKSDLFTIYNVCKEKKCNMSNYLGISDFSADDIKPSFESFNIEDILGRESQNINKEEIFKFVEDKIVFVTGGAGSIGSEICRQVLAYGCSLLVAVDFNENGLFYLNQELENAYEKNRYVTMLASVCDTTRMEKLFEKYRPDIVLHAAAHKHVPLMEINAGEAVKNNIFGTENIVTLANKYDVKKFILISTDKAVNPTNVMGCTKRVAELIILKEQEKSKVTELAAVRFGNVLGSNGSVVHTFKKQIEQGGPITVTHPEIERFFMTIKEAVSLVLTAGNMAKGGEIFVLDMGTPVKIKHLAEDMIRLSGYIPNIDIKIEYCGLRPGEKMYEELNLEHEKTEKTDIEKIKIFNIKSDTEHLEKKLENLKGLTLSKNHVDYRKALMDIVPEYTPKL